MDDVIDIVGFDDLSARRYGGNPDPAVAFQKCLDEKVPVLVLAHQPNHLRQVGELGSKREILVISGHTHGGKLTFTYF